MSALHKALEGISGLWVKLPYVCKSHIYNPSPRQLALSKGKNGPVAKGGGEGKKVQLLNVTGTKAQQVGI